MCEIIKNIKKNLYIFEQIKISNKKAKHIAIVKNHLYLFDKIKRINGKNYFIEHLN
jgi:hypothetical protein